MSTNQPFHSSRSLAKTTTPSRTPWSEGPLRTCTGPRQPAPPAGKTRPAVCRAWAAARNGGVSLSNCQQKARVRAPFVSVAAAPASPLPQASAPRCTQTASESARAGGRGSAAGRGVRTSRAAWTCGRRQCRRCGYSRWRTSSRPSPPAPTSTPGCSPAQKQRRRQRRERERRARRPGRQGGGRAS